MFVILNEIIENDNIYKMINPNIVDLMKYLELIHKMNLIFSKTLMRKNHRKLFQLLSSL